MLRHLVLAAATAAVMAATSVPAGAGGAYGGALPYDLPVCDSSEVLADIVSKFDHADANVLHRGLTILAIDKIGQRYASQGNPSPVARRYCQAHAHLNDGRRHPANLYYLIEQGQGFAGIGWNVEFCMPGYEPWHVHDGACRTVRRWW